MVSLDIFGGHYHQNTQLLQLLTDRHASLGPTLCRQNRIPKGLSDAPTHQKLTVAIGEDRMTITQTVESKGHFAVQKHS